MTDDLDLCPGTLQGVIVNLQGCSAAQADSELDDEGGTGVDDGSGAGEDESDGSGSEDVPGDEEGVEGESGSPGGSEILNYLLPFVAIIAILYLKWLKEGEQPKTS